ncbi:MAG TPA: alpha/beta fold hydrolase [Phycisphaerae bacterium]|nr:alpha/beta fold hydrolase [Phycisphaerae bacterium]
MTPDDLPSRTFPLLDQPAVLDVAFHPRRQAFGEARADGRTVRVAVADGVALGGRLHVAAAGAPLILFFHGNGELAAEYDGIAGFYTERGITLLTMDYRGYGTSDGAPTATNLVADAVAVWRGLPDLLGAHGLRPPRTYVMGRSLGSVAAIEIADRAGGEVAGLIIESGFADTFGIVRRLGGPELPGAEESRDGFDHPGKMSRIAAPTLILHGQADWIIPAHDAEVLHARSAAADKRLVILPEGDHNNLLFVARHEYFAAVGDFVSG